MKRDRTGELIEDDAAAAVRDRHADQCTGWRGEDSEGRPIPCLICKPHRRARTAIVHDFAVR